MTEQKKQILAFLMAHEDRHFSIEEILAGLSGERTPGKSTVYRQVSSLLADGVIRRFECADSDTFVYQYCGGEGCEHHFHLKCSRCGRLIHTECGKLAEIREHILREHDFTIGGTSVIYGVCAACTRR